MAMSNNKENIIPFELLARYLSNDLSPGEKDAAEQWIDRHPDNRSTFEELESTWKSLDKIADIAPVDLELEWQRQQNTTGINDSMILQEKRNTIWNYARVAAVFIFIFISAAVIYYLGPSFGITNQITDRERQELTLSDGSVVSLNHGTQLEYPYWFGRNKRQLKLNGEAYFEVRPDAERPFIVITDHAVIRVVGTSFNVKAYESEPAIQVIVSDGIVAFSHEEDLGDKVVLEAGEKGILIKKSGAVYEQKNTDPNFLAWKTRSIIFKNEELENVFSTIGEIYDAEFIFQDNQLKNCRLTVTFDQQSLESVIQVIEATLQIRIEKHDNGYLISGDNCH